MDGYTYMDWICYDSILRHTNIKLHIHNVYAQGKFFKRKKKPLSRSQEKKNLLENEIVCAGAEKRAKKTRGKNNNLSFSCIHNIIHGFTMMCMYGWIYVRTQCIQQHFYGSLNSPK